MEIGNLAEVKMQEDINSNLFLASPNLLPVATFFKRTEITVDHGSARCHSFQPSPFLTGQISAFEIRFQRNHSPSR